MPDPAIDRNSGVPDGVTGAPDQVPVLDSVPCANCRKPIPAESFASWSTAKVLISAPCPDCHRRVTLTEAGIQHEFIITWWPVADRDGAAFAHAALDPRVDGPDARIASADHQRARASDGATTTDDAGLACLVDFGNQFGCWPRR
jgi:hypothetical protein